MSMSIKLMGVPGPKLMDDEQGTQDMMGVSTPTFVTPDTQRERELQHWSLQERGGLPLHEPAPPHILDSIMQLLWTKTQTSPLESEYFSCVPYLLGEGQAMQYSFRTRLKSRTRVPRLPRRPPDNYLRDAMVATLAEQDVEFDILLQVQTDPFKMPIENNGGAVADPAVAAGAGRRAADPEADVRLAGATRVRAGALVQPVALDRRAPPAGQPEPGPEADVLRAVTAAPADEQRRALRADRRRDLLTPMEAPLWTYPLTVVPLVGFCILIGTGVGWWFAAAIFVPALILIVLATAIGLRRKAERRNSSPRTD